MTDRYERIQQESEMNMNVIYDGGPAFPVWELNGQGKPEMTGFGLSIRDYFAAKAMAALIAEPLNEGGTTVHRTRHLLLSAGPDIIARAAYMMADAMLNAREASND